MQLLKVFSACISDMAAACDNTECKLTFLPFSTTCVLMIKGIVLGMVVFSLPKRDSVQQRKGSACEGQNEAHHLPAPAAQSK